MNNQLHHTNPLIVEDRRREVAALRRRRLTIRQIVKALADAGRVNPKTGTPWALGTIKKDLDALQAQYRAAAMRDVTEHKSEILADYDELMRIAWQERNHTELRHLLAAVRELLGTDAPQVLVIEQVTRIMDEALDRLEAEFRDDPTALARAHAALVGRPPGD